MSRNGISRREVLLSALTMRSAARILGAAQNPTFSAEVKVVNVLATVRNKHGEIVRNLQRDDFTLEEDGRAQVIHYFSRETDLPLTLGLLVDTSMSQRQVVGQERTASYRFLDQVLREGKDVAFVIHFDREVELLQDLTSSRKQLESGLGQLEAPQARRPQGGGARGGPPSPGGQRTGGTTLYDAVLLASDELMRKQSGRKALIVLSNGVDTGSKVSLASAVEAAQRADTLVYSIAFVDQQAYSPGRFGGPGWGGGRGRGGWGGSRMPRPANRPDGKKILERISKQTGGGFFEVSKKQPIERIYQRIEQELRSQYSLGFTSDRQDAGPGFRRIRLLTKDKALVVQNREGYYAR